MSIQPVHEPVQNTNISRTKHRKFNITMYKHSNLRKFNVSKILMLRTLLFKKYASDLDVNSHKYLEYYELLNHRGNTCSCSEMSRLRPYADYRKTRQAYLTILMLIVRKHYRMTVAKHTMNGKHCTRTCVSTPRTPYTTLAYCSRCTVRSYTRNST